MSRRIKMMQSKVIVVLGIFLYTLPAFAVEESSAFSEADKGSESISTESETKGNILHSRYFFAGYNFIENNDYSRVGQYVENNSSLALGLQYDTFPLPHRFSIEGEYLNTHDFYNIANYAYKDIILFQNKLVGIHHNLPHYNYLYPGEPPSITYNDRSYGDNNFVDFMKNDLSLRFKAPSFPFHTYINHRYVQREGSLQERFLIGYFGNLDKTSQSRDIDWKSNDLTLKLNSHLGPIEVEYDHNQFRFDPGPGDVMYDFFQSGRPPDTYPHNVTAKTESYVNTVLLHTSYTGQIVASATLSNEGNTNNYSGAESDVWSGAFDLQWMPDPTISMFFRYRRLDNDKKNPEHTLLNGFYSRTPYSVRTPVSTSKDLFTLSARYRPTGKVTLNGKYEFEIRKRDDIDDWELLREDSDIHRLNLTARARLMNNMKLRASYDYKHYEDPSYNTEPDNYNKLRLKGSYTPIHWLSALLDCSFTMSQRDDLLYSNNSSLVEGGEREGRTGRALLSFSFILNPKTSLVASWSYNRWKIEQDLAYSRWSTSRPGFDSVPYYDYAAPFTDQSHVFSLSFYSKLREDLNFKAGLSYTIAESEYLPNPLYLTAINTKETTDTVAQLELAKKLMQNWEVGLKFMAGYSDDDFSNETLDHKDGEMYVSLLTLKRYF